MENKINIAELLKDCPQGMELDCPLFENLEFDHIDKDNKLYPIRCRVKAEWGSYNFYTFTEYGCYGSEKYSKCVIFPKGKTTWEGFQRPFKDGDILTYTGNYTTTFIYRNKENEPNFSTSFYVACNNAPFNNFLIYNKYALFALNGNCDVRLATEEEKEKLFKAIKANGYKWNEETKTLEKLPKFKGGDRIKYINGKNKDGVEQGVILSLTNDTYDVAVTNDMGIFVPIAEQDNWELVPNKFDITTLKPFDKVLVRDSNEGMWSASIFSHTWENKYICIGVWYNQCIPYEGNEHLLGITNDCDDFYKTWE